MKKKFKNFITFALVLITALCIRVSPAMAWGPTDGQVIKNTSVGEQLKAIDSTTGWWLVAEKDKLGWVNAEKTSYWSTKTAFPILLKANASIPIYEGLVLHYYSAGDRIDVVKSVGGWWQVLTPQGKYAWVYGGNTTTDSRGLVVAKTGSVKAYSATRKSPSGNPSQVVTEALSCLGIPYKWGGTTRDGFDCSGLTQYVYNRCGIDVSRTTYTQWKRGDAVNSQSDLVPGDLVFFDMGSQGPEHVGIYIGNGKYLHAPDVGDVVKISQLSSARKYCGARRIFN